MSLKLPLPVSRETSGWNQEDDECEYEYIYESDVEYSADEGDDEVHLQEHANSGDPMMTAENAFPSGRSYSSSTMNSHMLNSTGARLYSIHSYMELTNSMRGVVKSISSVLDIPSDQAQAILMFNRWDEELVIEKYLSDSFGTTADAGVELYDPNRIIYWFRSDIAAGSLKTSVSSMINSQLFNCAGLGSGATAATRSLVNSMDSNVSFQCKICYDEFSTLNDGFSLGCGHVFCKDCFRMFLQGQIAEGPLCLTAQCPEHKCTQLVTEAVYKLFLQGDEASGLYDRYLIRNFIEASKNYRYCPAPNCESILCSVGRTCVNCSCGEVTCFGCMEEAHQPCDCETVKKWTEKCLNDSETANWMLVNTKQCPKCHTRIEKNQGCNHMTCRQCRHDFCWLCCGDWRNHSSCNRFNGGTNGSGDSSTTGGKADKGKAATDEEKRLKAKRELDRYMHYYARFQAHDIALKFAIKQRTATEALLEKLVTQGNSISEILFIRDAAEQVIACRRVLKYTYVMGYYMPSSAPCRLLFERHQEMLEENTEKLHEFTEQKDLKKLDRQLVTNITRITERFRDSLLEDITDDAIRSNDMSIL